MPFGIFDKLRWSGSTFQIENPQSQFDAAICSALLAPDVLQHVSSSGLEHVSGGCWPEDRKALVNTSQDSSRPGHPRPRCSSWHRSQCSSYGQEEHVSSSDVMRAAFDADLVWRNCICVEAFRSHTPCFPPRHQHTQKRYDQASHPAMNNFACVEPCTPCYGSKHKRLERSLAIDCGTSERDDLMHDFRTHETSNVMRMSDRQEAMRDSGVGSDTKPARHPLSAERVSANTSTDTLSVTASSAILSPATMPKVVRARATADESSDCDSMGSNSAFSVEADEMIEMQSHAWRHLFRDVWHRARSIRGIKVQKIGGSLKYRSIS
jgi:hypothetical protein